MAVVDPGKLRSSSHAQFENDPDKEFYPRVWCPHLGKLHND